MTDESTVNSNQASGGKVWNPFHKETGLPIAYTKWYDKPGPLSLLGLGILIAFIFSAYLSWKIWAGIHDPNRDYVSNHVYHMLGGYSNYSALFYIIPLLLFFILYGVVFNLSLMLLNKKPYLKFIAFVNSAYIKGIYLLLIGMVIVVFTGFGDMHNRPIEEKYNNWLKDELQVSKIVKVSSLDIDGKAYQGKDGVYELVKDEKQGYTTFTLKKVNL
jgi:hypothetical protein